MAEWVVRAGIATPERLMQGYRRHTGAPGIYGFSVQYEPGTSIDELAHAGRFPNTMISYALESELASVLLPLHYRMQLVRSPGTGYHHTFMVLYDVSGHLLKRLPLDAAEAISQAFKRTRNPYHTP